MIVEAAGAVGAADATAAAVVADAEVDVGGAT